MNIGAPFISNAQAPETGQPAERTFNDPAPAAKALTGLNAASSDARRDAAFAQPVAVAPTIIAFVSMEFCRALAGSSRETTYFWQRRYQPRFC